VETNRNHASGENVGCWTSLAGVDPSSQKRCYSAPAYYVPAAKRENLVLLAEATAREILLEEDGNDWAAKGVRFAHEGREYTARVEGEVILSAGSVQSPQLLELSGIGNPQILKAAGIDVKVENPNVGENLQEHMCKTQCSPNNFKARSLDNLISNYDGLRDRSLDFHP
jgi:choline dehydrogenase-like flavoprotein